MKHTKNRTTGRLNNLSREGSLTVEAALVMPLFLYFMIAFLYLIQIFTLQEYIQSAITQMGLNMAKTAYIYDDFQGTADALNFDATVFGAEIEIGLGDFAASVLDNTVLEIYAGKYLDTDRINKSCIRQGFDGISFYNSRILKDDKCVDIIVRYHIKIPVKLFSLEDMQMIQRVRVRGWTGCEVPAAYAVKKEGTGEDTVYVTDTGTVYHKSLNCSHIHLSVRAVHGIPSALRNDSGAKYYPCEACCKSGVDNFGIFYITSDGTRYHSSRSCSKIKRNVRGIPLSEVGNRLPCKRCGN